MPGYSADETHSLMARFTVYRSGLTAVDTSLESVTQTMECAETWCPAEFVLNFYVSADEAGVAFELWVDPDGNGTYYYVTTRTTTKARQVFTFTQLPSGRYKAVVTDLGGAGNLVNLGFQWRM